MEGIRSEMLGAASRCVIALRKDLRSRWTCLKDRRLFLLACPNGRAAFHTRRYPR